MMNGELKDLSANVEEVVSFPVLTRETSRDYVPASGSGGAMGGSLGAVAQRTIREVLGWRYRERDPKGFLAALNKAFTLREVGGRTEWDYKPQTYMLQADLGEITGAQASIYKQAAVAVEQALPLLDGLEPLRPDVDHEDTEAMRAIIRTELRALTDELAQAGGPRVQRVDLFFHELLGNPPVGDADTVGGQLGRLRQRFGLERDRVNTIEEEQNLTNFIILVDYVSNLFRSWTSKRDFFSRSGAVEPFLGTQLVLLSQSLDVILEQVRETYGAMDSVFFGAAERQATTLTFVNEAPITVAELLGWVESFSAAEGRELLQGSGKDGVVIFRQTLERLTQLIRLSAAQSSTPSSNPVRAFHSRRVAISLQGLESQLVVATKLASGIRRAPPKAPNVPGEDENVPVDLPVFVAPRAQPVVARVEVYLCPHGNGGRELTTHLRPGDRAVLVLIGRNLTDELRFGLGQGIGIRASKFESRTRVQLHVRVASNATQGPRDLEYEDVDLDDATDARNRVQFVENVFRVQGPREKMKPQIHKEIAPVSVGLGRCLVIEGANLQNVGVNLEDDAGFVIRGVQYSQRGKRVDVQLDVLDTVVPSPEYRVIVSSIYGEDSAPFEVVADGASAASGSERPPATTQPPASNVTTAQASE